MHLATSSTSLTTSKTFCFTRGDCCAHRGSLIGAPVRGVGDLQKVRQELEMTILLKYIYDYMHVKTMYIYIYIIYVQFNTVGIRPHMQRHAYKMQTLKLSGTAYTLYSIRNTTEGSIYLPRFCESLTSNVVKCVLNAASGQQFYQRSINHLQHQKIRCTYKAILISVSSMLIFEVEISMECLPAKLADDPSHYCKCMQVLI